MVPVFIGIAGGTGSGKTTVASQLVTALPAGRAVLIQHDWYYRDRSRLDPAARSRVNFDEPDALENELLVQDLAALREGRAVECPQYDFTTHTRLDAPRTIMPHPVIVVEGILLFTLPSLRDAFDLRVFVDTDDDIRLLRRIRRDIDERGRDVASVERQYLASVRPMHARHVAPSREYAHVIIPEGGENALTIENVVARLLGLLRA